MTPSATFCKPLCRSVSIPSAIACVRSSVDEASHQEMLRLKQDELLELYSAWRSGPSPEIEQSVERVVGEIRQFVPDFRFELPKG